MVSGSSRLGGEMNRKVVLEKWVATWPRELRSTMLARDLGVSWDTVLHRYGGVGVRVSMVHVSMGDVDRAVRAGGRPL
jgi:hypothetical protein